MVSSIYLYINIYIILFVCINSILRIVIYRIGRVSGVTLVFSTAEFRNSTVEMNLSYVILQME